MFRREINIAIVNTGVALAKREKYRTPLPSPLVGKIDEVFIENRLLNKNSCIIDEDSTKQKTIDLL